MPEANGFSPRFPKSEFGSFPAEYEEKAAYFSRTLARASLVLGPMIITSYHRPNDPGSAHHTGDAVDVVPTAVSRDFAHAWLAVMNYTARTLTGTEIYGEILNEIPREDRGETTGHIHMTLPKVGGRGEILMEVSEGSFVPGFRYENVVIPVLLIGLLFTRIGS